MTIVTMYVELLLMLARGDKTVTWTTECENREAVTHIGRVYEERLGLPPNTAISCQLHTHSATKSGPTTKYIMSIIPIKELQYASSPESTN
ncbi:hypothetical protein A6R68_19667, partial [Neotoma lepida]